MARYDHLPIWKAAVSLAALLEDAERRFPRYHNYALGADLRRQETFLEASLDPFYIFQDASPSGARHAP